MMLKNIRDVDPLIFGLPDMNLRLFLTDPDPDPTCNNT